MTSLTRLRSALAGILAFSAAILIGLPSVAQANQSESAVDKMATTTVNSSETEAAGVPVVNGYVTRDGLPVDGEVLAIASPEQSAFASYVEGDVIPLAAVGSAVTDSSGWYELAIDSTRVPTGYIDGGGQINLDLRFSDATSEASYSISIGLNQFAPVDAGVPSISVDLGTGKVKDSTIDSAEMEDLNGETIPVGSRPLMSVEVVERSRALDEAVASLASGSGVLPLACGDYVIDRRYDKSEYVHRLQGTTNLHATAIAKSGRDEVMGVAASRTGGVGTYSQSGTWSVSKSSTTSMGPLAGSYFVGNTVSYKHVRNDCNTAARFRWKPDTIQVYLNIRKTVTRKSFAKCTTVPSLWAYTKDETRAVTISAGVTVADVGLTAQSGWNSQSSLSFGPSTGSAKICYSNPAGLDESASISANPS